MQPNLVPITQSWADRILTLFLGLVGGGTVVGIISLIVNRAKRKSEVAARDAKTEDLRTDTFGKQMDMLMRLQDRLNHVEATSDQRETDCREQTLFLQASITYQRQMLSAYIKRGHEFAGEVEKAILYINLQAVDLATAIERIKAVQNTNGLPEGVAAELTNLAMLIAPQSITFRTREEIDRKYPLPPAPDGVETD